MSKSFTRLDYWRLADELSAVDAAFLFIGCDPGNHELEQPDEPATSRIRLISGFSDEQLERTEYEDTPEYVFVSPSQFRAVFKAIRNAVFSNKLKARFVNKGRGPSIGHHFEYGPSEDIAEANEEKRNYGFALSRGIPTVYTNVDAIHDYKDVPAVERVMYIIREPDWHQTTIAVEELKRWFKSRGLLPMFFFPDGLAEGFRDNNHPRYSAKLATAIAAWEAVKRPAKNKSVKASLLDWIVSNGVRFGLGSEGVVSPTAAEEVAKICNWHTSGGATPTYTEEDDEHDRGEAKIENFQEVAPVQEYFDPEIPF